MKKRLVAAVAVLSTVVCMSVPVCAAPGVSSIDIVGGKKVNKGAMLELDTVIYPRAYVNDYQIIWKSSNPKVARVMRNHDDDTKIKGVKAGKATITVRIAGTKIKDKIKITVKKAKKSYSTALTKAKSQVASYSTQAKAIRSDISRSRITASNYYTFQSRINSLERKLEILEDTWETRFDFGQVSYSSYSSLQMKIETVEHYLDSAEDYLEARGGYRYDYDD